MLARLTEAAGAASLVAGAFLLAPWLGLVTLGAALVAAGNAMDGSDS